MWARSGTSFSSVLIMPLPVKQRRPGHARRRRHTLRGPEVLELAELPDPVPGPGQVANDVAYAAVGLVDIYIRQGLEVAGTIRALGDDVDGFHIAEPVVTL